MNADESYDKVAFKALASVKLNGKHFHLICDAWTDDNGETIVLMRPDQFEDGEFPSEAHCIEYRFDGDRLTRVEGEEYRYLCKGIADLDQIR